MFAIERYQKIKEMLVTEKHVDVSRLSKLFSVSEVTIRRDLEKLAKGGFIIKTYGGAVLNEETSSGPTLFADPAHEIETESNEDQKRIGRIAADMIQAGDAVFLTPGPNCLEIARNLHTKKAVTVVTNDLNIAMALRECGGVKTIVTGGDLVLSVGILVGQFAQKVLKGIFIHKAFVGVAGVSLESGYTVGSYEEAELIRTVLEISSETIIVAEHSRFQRTAFARLGDLTMAGKIITNHQVAGEYKKFFFEHAIKLFATYELE